MLVVDDLLRIPSQQRQIEQQRNPISVDEEEERQECVDGGFRDDVRVQAVAEIDRVDVVAKVIVSILFSGSVDARDKLADSVSGLECKA